MNAVALDAGGSNYGRKRQSEPLENGALFDMKLERCDGRLELPSGIAGWIDVDAMSCQCVGEARSVAVPHVS